MDSRTGKARTALVTRFVFYSLQFTPIICLMLVLFWQFFVENPEMIDGSWRGAPEYKEFWAKEPHASRGGPNSSTHAHTR